MSFSTLGISCRSRVTVCVFICRLQSAQCQSFGSQELLVATRHCVVKEQAARDTPKAVSSFDLSSCSLSARLATRMRFAPISANCSAAALHSTRAD